MSLRAVCREEWINCTAIRLCGVIKSDDKIIKNDNFIIKNDDRFS
jgi:hypothetical protein